MPDIYFYNLHGVTLVWCLVSSVYVKKTDSNVYVALGLASLMSKVGVLGIKA